MYRKKTNEYDFTKFLANLTRAQEEKNRRETLAVEEAATLLGRGAAKLYQDTMWEGIGILDREATLADLERRNLRTLSFPEGAD